MWSDQISDTILTNYEEYALNERKEYEVDPESNMIQGGLRGLYKLLGITFNVKMPPMEILSDHPYQDARKLADSYFKKSGNPLTYVRTVVINRKLEVFAGIRMIASVYIEGTAKVSVLKKDGMLYTSPKLQMIDLMWTLYNPRKYDDREDAIDLATKLLDNFLSSDKSVSTTAPTHSLKIINPMLRDRLVVSINPSHIILISNMSSTDEAEMLKRKLKTSVDVHAVRLPKEFFLQKITFMLQQDSKSSKSNKKKKRKIKYSIYNAGSYELLPYRMVYDEATATSYKQAISSVVSRIHMIEDNTVESLIHSGYIKGDNIKSVKFLYNREDILKALSEKYPPAFDATKETGFYGIYKDIIVMEKLMIKSQEKKRYYFPAYEQAKNNQQT